MRIVLSEKSKFDLLRVYHYLAERNTNAADDFARRIDSNFQNLARFPFIGRERESLAPPLPCRRIASRILQG